jgi:hypothetical protein
MDRGQLGTKETTMPARRKYNWEEWFGRPVTLLTRGADYNCSQSIMCAVIRNEASERRVRIRLRDEGDSIIIEVVDAVPHPDKTTIAG